METQLVNSLIDVLFLIVVLMLNILLILHHYLDIKDKAITYFFEPEKNKPHRIPSKFGLLLYKACLPKRLRDELR